MRIRKKPWAEKELTESTQLIRSPESYKERWHTYFKNQEPIHLELGCGKGRFIIQTAQRNSDTNFLAMEKEPMAIVSGLRSARETDSAVGFIAGDVANLPQLFAPGEISRIYINFCDPWPARKKWRKRRLTHVNFLKMYREVLGGQGEVFFKTDNRELFEFSLNQFADDGWRLRNITLDLHASDFADNNIMTEYEEKFHSLGMPIYRLEAFIYTL